MTRLAFNKVIGAVLTGKVTTARTPERDERARQLPGDTAGWAEK